MSSRFTNKKSTASQKQERKAAPRKLLAIKPLVSNSQAKKTKASQIRSKEQPTKKLTSQAFTLSSTAFSVCLALSSVTLPTIINPAYADGPKGGVIVGGEGDISKMDATTTLINQSSHHIAIND